MPISMFLDLEITTPSHSQGKTCQSIRWESLTNTITQGRSSNQSLALETTLLTLKALNALSHLIRWALESGKILRKKKLSSSRLTLACMIQYLRWQSIELRAGVLAPMTVKVWFRRDKNTFLELAPTLYLRKLMKVQRLQWAPKLIKVWRKMYQVLGNTKCRTVLVRKDTVVQIIRLAQVAEATWLI